MSARQAEHPKGLRVQALHTIEGDAECRMVDGWSGLRYACFSRDPVAERREELATINSTASFRSGQMQYVSPRGVPARLTTRLHYASIPRMCRAPPAGRCPDTILTVWYRQRKRWAEPRARKVGPWRHERGKRTDALSGISFDGAPHGPGAGARQGLGVWECQTQHVTRDLAPAPAGWRRW